MVRIIDIIVVRMVNTIMVGIPDNIIVRMADKIMVMDNIFIRITEIPTYNVHKREELQKRGGAEQVDKYRRNLGGGRSQPAPKTTSQTSLKTSVKVISYHPENHDKIIITWMIILFINNIPNPHKHRLLHKP